MTRDDPKSRRNSSDAARDGETGDLGRDRPVAPDRTRATELVRATARHDTPQTTGERGLSVAAEERRTPFFSFRYSYRSVTLDRDRAHIQAREARFEDGRLETEEFEGTTGAASYLQAVVEMQRRLAGQFVSFMGALPSFMGALPSLFNPFLPPGSDLDDE